jgi:hypothetical protein
MFNGSYESAMKRSFLFVSRFPISSLLPDLRVATKEHLGTTLAGTSIISLKKEPEYDVRQNNEQRSDVDRGLCEICAASVLVRGS